VLIPPAAPRSDNQDMTHPMTRRLAAKITTAGTALLLGAFAVGLSACGNAITVHPAGQLGMTVDRAGQPVLAVMTCFRATPAIDLAEGRPEPDPGTQPNVQRGSWQARKGFSGVQRIAFATSGENWTSTKRPGTLEPGKLFVATGGTLEDKDANLAQVSFRAQDLARLTPDQVLVEEGKVEPLSTFSAYTC
jgi:hypothetical protein